MGTPLFRVAVSFCLACLVFSQNLSMYPSPESQWYEIGYNVTMTCQWQHDSDAAVEISWRHDGNSIRKITEGNDAATYVYRDYTEDCESCAQPQESRQEENHNFDEEAPEGEMKMQSSELTIFSLNLNDPRSYTCRIELSGGIAEESTDFNFDVYMLPTVDVVGVNIFVDIRSPIEPPTTPAPTESVNANETEVIYDDYENNYNGENMNDEPADSVEQFIIVECRVKEAYPEPNVVFKIGDGEPMVPTNIEWDTGSDTEPWSGVATLNLTADTMYDGKSVSCSAIIPTEPEAREIPAEIPSSVIEIYHEVTGVSTTISPEIANAGDTVEIICTSDGNPRPTLSVSSDVGEKPSFEMSDDGSVFTIASVIKGDAGVYWCVATLPSRPGGTSEEQTMESKNKPELTVYYNEEPTLSEEQDIVLQQGDSRTVTCDGNWFPQEIPLWKKDGREFKSGRTLEINNADYNAEGTYTCEATNDAGTRTKSIDIKVQGACVAEIELATVSSSSKEAGTNLVKLKCVANGQPKCSVDISSQSNFGVVGDKTETTENGNPVQILEFGALPKLSAPVQFFCVADNTVGRSNVSLELNKDTKGDVCCEEPAPAGMSIGAIIGIILLVLVIVIGIPVACYFVKKRKAEPKKKDPEAGDAAEPGEKEELHKEASSEGEEP